MKYLFEISKEHKTIPKSEILSILYSGKIDFNILESNEDVFIIKTNVKNEILKKLAERLSYTYYLDEFFFSCSNSIYEIKKFSLKNIIKRNGSIAIKYKNRSNKINSQPIVKVLAKVYTKNRLVNLENPDIELRVLITDKKIYVGLKIYKINRTQFEERKVQNRPFFSPISLHPKLARALVNLSSIKKGEVLLDPFCGTGGILIEAGLIGLKIIGSDIEEKMINGCKKTFDFYNINNYKLFHSDVGKVKKHVSKVDAIVTDLPYGKSTTTKGENMEKLYNRAFKNMSELLKDKKLAVIGFSNENLISLGERYFKLINKHTFQVHKSLKRNFVVFKK
jgi:tRNA (guanine10-N2)-dimethyltransferase